MNKQDITIVVLLFMLLLGWGYWQRVNYVPPPPKAKVAAQAGSTNDIAAAQSPDTPVVEPEIPPLKVSAELVKQPEIRTPQASSDEGHSKDEEIAILSNDLMNVRVSSWGGGIVSVELKNYRATQDRDSGPLCLDFTRQPAVSLSGIPGLSTNSDYDVRILETSNDGGATKVMLGRTTKDGLCFARTIAISNNYMLQIAEVFSNSTPASLTIPAYGLAVGPMHETATNSSSGGISYLGLDTLPVASGSSVTYWGKTLPQLFGAGSSFLGCSRQNTAGMPTAGSRHIESSNEWVAAKSKFFVQILAPSVSGIDCELQAQRDTNVSGSLVVSSVSARFVLPERVIPSGDTFESEINYYVGPKEYSALKQLSNHQVEVMEFGKWFGWLCPPLLVTMTAIYKFLPNYGVAVILLTCLVRLILWPITRKATQSMKEMQKVQPLVNELRTKYKDKPQKMNTEIMALYKEHKVNPMAGCLPIVLQIPVFIALFTVLQSAVELRFAHFLWISDLSQPEGLFAGTAFFAAIPFVKALNILPLLMTATTIWQQRLTPAAGDPQQQKMMMFMPVIFLAMFYNMASALVLYWTVSQLLSILGLYWQKRIPSPAVDTAKKS